MFRETPLTAVVFAVVGLGLMVVGANAGDIKGQGGMVLPETMPQDRGTSVGACRGCSPSSLQNCRSFVWYQGWTSTTNWACANCRSFKDMADKKCNGFDQRAEDDLDIWVLHNCGVRVDCEHTRVQSSNISGTKKKRRRFILCDKCKFVNLKYTCTYDFACTVQL